MSAEVEAWLRQARADLKAGSSRERGPAHCHRRYWLQQACEKGIKALGRLLWSAKNVPDAQKAFEANFLYEHSPLLKLGKYVTPSSSTTSPSKKAVPTELVIFHNQLDTELRGIDRRGVLQKVDATKPSHNPMDRSYRYPFQAASGSFRAPCDCKAAEWNAYQGRRDTVIRAIARLLDRVENRAKVPAPP